MFVTNRWEVIGSKGAPRQGDYRTSVGRCVEEDVERITGIPHPALSAFELTQGYSIEERFSWMNGRRTTREEDKSYSLYGIFGVTPGTNYGEGHERARRRLLAAIQYRDSLVAQQVERFQKIKDWLSPPDPWVNHRSARQLHESQTGSWLLESSQYQSWKTTSVRHLWISGKPGCGKTVLCSTAIEDVKAYCEHRPDVGYAIFYFSFSDDRKQRFADLLCSLVVQLGWKGSALQMLQKAFEKPNRSMLGTDELEKILYLCFESYDRVFLLLDALDECPEEDNVRHSTLECLARLSQKVQNVHMLATSRERPDIRRSTRRLEAIPMDIATHAVDGDIRRYMATQLSRDHRLSRLDQKTKTLIEETISAKADGMFRFAYCQLRELKKLKASKPKYIKDLLLHLPATLDATYERMLSRIEEIFHEEALRLLHWLAYAQSPPSLGELAEAAVIDLAREGSVKIEERGAIEDTMEILSGLVVVVTGTNNDNEWDNEGSEAEYESNDDDASEDDYNEDHDCDQHISHRTTVKAHYRRFRKETKVRLAHFSVKEYLESEHILQGKAKDFYLESAIGHRLLAQSCLIYIMYYSRSDEKTATRRDFATFPLLQYAAQSWYYHSSLQGSEDAEREIRLLGSEDLKEDWLLVHQPDREYALPFEGLEGVGSDVYYASVTGLEAVVRKSLEKGANAGEEGGEYGNALQAASHGGHEKVVQMLMDAGADVNSDGGRYGNALQAASLRGHEKVVQMLMDAGADVNAQGGEYGNALQAASYGAHVTLAKTLIENGANVRARGGVYDNALLAAFEKNHEEMAQMLIANGADVNTQSEDCGHDLCIASIRGYTEIAQLLLDRGADVNAPARRFGSALQAACLAGHLALVQLLLKHGANIEAVAESGETPLQTACAAGATDVAETLLKYGADANASPGSHGTALRAAALNGAGEIVSKLLKHGANPATQTPYNGDALFVASRGGFRTIVQELLDYGADANTYCQHVSAIQAAKREEHYDIVDILLDAGAVSPDQNELAVNTADGKASDVGQLLQRQLLGSDDETDSDMETIAESIFTHQESGGRSRPVTTTSASRSEGNQRGEVISTKSWLPKILASSTRREYADRYPITSQLNQQMKPKKAEKGLHSAIFGERLLSKDMSDIEVRPPAEDSSPMPLTLDEGLARGNILQITLLLDQHLDIIATGHWKWLPELFELGFDTHEVADILLEQHAQKPMIHFEPWAPRHRRPQLDGHMQNCVHGGGNLRSLKDSQHDLRATVASLCGIAGVVPIIGRESEWSGQVEFDYGWCPSVSYSRSQEKPDDVLGILKRTTDALNGFCSGAAEFQSYGGCCDRYTYICTSTSRESGVVDALRLAVMPFSLSVRLLESLQQAQEDLTNPSRLDTCASHAQTILNEVLPDWARPQIDITSIGMKVHYCALAVQLLCLTFVSYCQAHLGPMQFFFVEREFKSARLFGAPGALPTLLYPTIRFDLQRLTCLDSMLGGRVIVFHAALQSNSELKPRSDRRYDIIATLEDLIDTWGPAGLVSSHDKSNVRSASSIHIRGGTIQWADGLGHWTYNTAEREPPGHIVSLTEPIRIGALVRKNPLCNPDETRYLHAADGIRENLGSYEPFWMRKQRQAGIVAGQYFNIQFIDVFEKDPGRTLKEEKVENLYRILIPSSSDQLLPLLESSWGLQVSFCSGLARRVKMRELFADILPIWMQRKSPCLEKWRSLNDTHQIVYALQQGDLYHWICQVFEHDRDCYQFFCEAVVEITNQLVPTGVDKSGDYFVVAWITARKDVSPQCIKVPVRNENFWTRVLQDSRDCATFAYMTMECLQVGGQGCQNPDLHFPFQIRLAETEVHRHFDTPQAQMPATPQSQWTLQHRQVYAIGKLRLDAMQHLRALVNRPTLNDNPRLIVKPRNIPNGIWLRVLQRRTELGRLCERNTPLDRVQGVILASTEET